MAGTTSYQFGVQYGASSSFNTTNVPIANGQMYFVTQGSGTDYVLGYVDLGSTRYAIGAPIPNVVPTATNLEHALTVTLSGKALSYSGGNDDVSITDNFIITNSATGASAATGNLTNGNVFLNRTVATQVGTAAASTSVTNLFKITGSGPISVAYTKSTNLIQISAPAYPTQLPNPSALSWGSKSYDGSDTATITLSDLGGLASGKAISSVAMSSGGVITITFADNTTKTSTAPSSWTIKATTAGTADSANKVNTALTWNNKSYDGSSSSNTEITSSDVQTLAAGLAASALNWEGFTVPLANIPATAQERLYVAPAATSGQTELQAATTYLTNNSGVTAGDVIQVGSGAMFYVYDNNGSRALKEFSAGIANTAATVQNGITFKAAAGDAGVAAGTTWNGSNSINVGYATVGAAPAGSEISSGAFGGTGNRTLTLTKSGGGTVTASLPSSGKVGINISGKADTAGTADKVSGILTVSVAAAAASVSGTVASTGSVSYQGNTSPTITYTPNSAITQGNVIGWLTLGASSPVAITSGMFWTTF